MTTINFKDGTIVLSHQGKGLARYTVASNELLAEIHSLVGDSVYKAIASPGEDIPVEIQMINISFEERRK